MLFLYRLFGRVAAFLLYTLLALLRTLTSCRGEGRGDHGGRKEGSDGHATALSNLIRTAPTFGLIRARSLVDMGVSVSSRRVATVSAEDEDMVKRAKARKRGSGEG